MLRSSSTTRILAKRLLPQRNFDRKGGSDADSAAHKNSPVMRLDDFLGDIESQAGRAGLAGHRRSLRVRFEDRFQGAAVDSASGIADHHAHGAVMLRQFDCDASA